MRTFSKGAVTAAGLALAAAAALNAQNRPESLLPPGFDQPVAPQPAPSPTRTSRPAPLPGVPADPVPAPASGATPGAVPDAVPGTGAAPSPTPSPSATLDPAVLAKYELPDYARRSLTRIGVSGVDGLPADAFGNADGRFLEGLMRRIDAPVPSRWLSIALRRALVSAVNTPAKVNGADFAAERAWLLVRMGESTSARAVVQGVDPDNATPKLMQVTMQAALATGDPAAMCPYADRGPEATRERGWALAKAMCLAMSAEPAQATAAIRAAGRRGPARGIDLSLAEKVVGAGADSRRAVTIEWPGVDRLSAWRWGLAAATGVEVPEDMMASVGPQVRYWHALSPVYTAANRAADAELAAAQGVLSNAALVDLFGEVQDSDENYSATSNAAGDLRTAYAGSSAQERIAAMTTLWNGPSDEFGRYGRAVLTARAAARIRPGDGGEASDRLVASMLTAGLDRSALRWLPVLTRGGDGWAMVTLADPRRGGLGLDSVQAYSGTPAKQAMFFAGLAGLGRLSAGDVATGAQDLSLDLAGGDAWSRAIDAAARSDQPGTVLLLCAAGMQTQDWRGVRPAMLYRMVTALRATGLEGYARMMAAEAVARLPAA